MQPKLIIFEGYEYRYIVGLLHSLENHSEDLWIIFRGKQEVLCAKLEERLHGVYHRRSKTKCLRVWQNVRWN